MGEAAGSYAHLPVDHLVLPVSHLAQGSNILISEPHLLLGFTLKEAKEHLATINTTWYVDSNPSPDVIFLWILAVSVTPSLCAGVHCLVPTALCLPTFHSFFHSLNSFYSGPNIITNHISPNLLLPQASHLSK